MTRLNITLVAPMPSARVTTADKVKPGFFNNIRFGTTRTVVAAADRGNYPVVSFHTEDGDALDWYPSLAAARGDEIVFGFDAAQKQGVESWSALRSFKRRLGAIGPDEHIEIGDHKLTALELLTGFLSALRRDLLTRSNLRVKRNEKLQATISVPANANSNQRFITLEAFRRAGFEAPLMMNEPSAAGIEYAHHLAGGGSSKRETLVVYDLGGGTFDSAVINLVDRDHEAIASDGIAKLGGDNFDVILLNMA
ncbi:MAG TPA: Hsp70 family protein, partial [Blastocatellia bacterium]